MWTNCTVCGATTWADGPKAKGDLWWHGGGDFGHHFTLFCDVPDENPVAETVTMPKKKEFAHIPTDPITWIDRLMIVNDGSAFAREQQAIIRGDLITLRERLTREKDTRCVPQ